MVGLNNPLNDMEYLRLNFLNWKMTSEIYSPVNVPKGSDGRFVANKSIVFFGKKKETSKIGSLFLEIS